MRKRSGTTDGPQSDAPAASDQLSLIEPPSRSASKPPEKNQLAVEMGRRGGKKGGAARAAKMSPEERAASSRAAAQARWGTTERDAMPFAIFGSTDSPLRIGDIEIPCYVLDDRRRVLVQRALQAAIGMSNSGGSDGAQRMALLIENLAEKGMNCSDLAARIRNPILFKFKVSGSPAYGYEATIINDICDTILEARKLNKLHNNQKHFAIQCEVLLRGLARVGIVDLVDRATGYDRVRFRENIDEIVEKFVAKEIQKWIRTFPTEYYESIFRLNNWPFDPSSTKRPGIVGHWTNDIVYARLAPGVLEELRRLTPRDEKGRLKSKLTRRLTPDMGHPRLREHLSGVCAIMRISKGWQGFYRNLDEAYPRFDATLQLPFEDAKAMEAIEQDKKDDA